MIENSRPVGLGLLCPVLAMLAASCARLAGPAAPIERSHPSAAATPEPAKAPVKPAATTSPASSRPPAAPVLPMSLFDADDKTLTGWKVVDQADFEMHGKVYVQDGTIVLEAGSPMTGITWTGEFPREDYEVSLEAVRLEGTDFFCGMTFPVGDFPCTLILGGWGGCVVGLSNIDGMHAAENETTLGMTFENGQWYRVRLRVTAAKIEVWIDDDQKIDLTREGHQFSIWTEQEPVAPFGIATWYTKAALRDLSLRGVRASP